MAHEPRLFLNTTIGAALADNFWDRATTVGNKTRQDPTVDNTAESVWNRPAKIRLMKGKGTQTSKRAHGCGNRSSKQIGVQLHKLQQGKRAKTTDRTTESVIVQIQLSQVDQLVKFRRERTSQCIKVQIDKDQVFETANFSGDGALEVALFHSPNRLNATR